MTATRKAKGTEAPPAASKPVKPVKSGRRVTSTTAKKRGAVAGDGLETSEANSSIRATEPVDTTEAATAASPPKSRVAKTATKRATKASAPATSAAKAEEARSTLTEAPRKLESVAPESRAPESRAPESGLRVLPRGKRREVSEAPPAVSMGDALVGVPSVHTPVLPDPFEMSSITPSPVIPPVEATPAEVDELALLLGDSIARTSDAWVHYQVVMTHLGPEKVSALVARARAVQAAGGMPIAQGDGHRTLGGVFFALGREELGPVTWRELRKEVRKRAVRKPHAPAKPVRFEPEVVRVRRRSAL